MERHVLVVYPHPDDEAFGTAGTIVLNRREGVPVTYACLTLGEMGRNMGRPFFATRETLPLVRKKELQDACEIMGIEDLRMLGYRDKTLEFEDLDKVADHIGEIIKELNPSLVITFYPGHGVHPDHDACGAATVLAVSRLPKDQRPVLHCKAIMKTSVEILGEPDVVTDVSEVIDIKLDALKAHRSQTEGMFADMEEKLKENPDMLSWLKKETFWTYQW